MSHLDALRMEFAALRSLVNAKKRTTVAPSDAAAEGTHQGGHVYYAGGMGSFVKVPVRSVTMKTAPWAQHPNALHVEWVPVGKRKPQGTVVSPGSQFAYVPEGHEAPDPPSMWGEAKRTENGAEVRRGRYMSADSRWWSDLREKLPPTAVTYEGAEYTGGGSYAGTQRLARKHEHDGKDAAPPATTPGVPTGATTQVSPHIRHTAAGAVVQVAGHVRHLTAREAFKLKAAELRQHVETGGESGAVAQAELDRREAKRTGSAVTAPPPAARTAGMLTKKEQDAIIDRAHARAQATVAAWKQQRPPPWTPEQGRAEATRKLTSAESRKLADKARSKGQGLIDTHSNELNRDRMRNTARRAAMAAGAEGRALAKVNWGKRLVRLADAIDAGYEPDAFDHHMVNHPQAAELAADIHAQRRDLGDADTGEYKGSGTWTWKHKPVVHVYRADGEMRRAALLHGRHEGDYHDVPATPAAIAAFEAAAKKDKPKSYEVKSGYVGNLKARAHLGFHHASDHQRIAERYEQFRTLTGVDGQRGPQWAPPDRTHARDTFDDRLARAEKDEAKRWRAPEHGGIAGFFPTPAPEVEHMIERADIRPGMSVLEPSAGTGDIADRLPGDVHITVAEHNHTLRGVLEQKGYTVAPDALEVSGQFDRVVMNPPFERGQDMRHVMHAFEHNLKPGGRLVAIVGAGALSNSSNAHRAFQEFVAAHRADEDRPIRGDAWKRSGTAVNAVMITLDKPADMKKATTHRFWLAWFGEHLLEAA